MITCPFCSEDDFDMVGLKSHIMNGLCRVYEAIPLTPSVDSYMDEKITVCDKCLTASCWQGIFMCQESQNAGTVSMTRGELLKLNREHPDYMKTDEELS